MPRCPENGCITSDANPLVPDPRFPDKRICHQCAIVVENSYEFGEVMTGRSEEQLKINKELKL
jgi:hypothetical protein